MGAHTTLLSAFVALSFLCAGSLDSSAQDAARAKDAPQPKLTRVEILQALTSKQGEDLFEFLQFLKYPCDKSELSDQDLDDIRDQLLIIEKTDPYAPARTVKGVTEKAFFRNRWAAQNCLFGVRFQKVANGLRRLPVEQRVARVVEFFENPPAELKGWDTTGTLSRELVNAGAEAVPFILQHKPAKSYHRRMMVGALGEIGDPRGIDYVIEVLKNPAAEFSLERPIAAETLAAFKVSDPRVVGALVDALTDETFQKIDRHLPQRPTEGHKPYVGRFFAVQHAAAESLTKLTGKDWGLLFNEDHLTWSAWLRAGRPDPFAPALVERTDKEVAKLVAALLHRFMSARPNPWQPQNSLASEAAVEGIAGDLKPLGQRVVPMIAREYEARIQETPLWQKELRQWTSSLLAALDWDEAREAARDLR